MNQIITKAATLYKHWDRCQDIPVIKPEEMVAIDSKLEQQMWDFVAERMKIFYKKAAGEPFPWTEDPILRAGRFTQAYRELDRTSMDLHAIAAPVLHDFDLSLLNFAYMRWVGLAEPVRTTGLITFDPAHNAAAKDRFNAIEGVRFTSAYNSAIAGILSTGCKDRQEFIFEYLPRVIPAIAKIWKSYKGVSPQQLVAETAHMFGFNARFMCVEIAMDMGYQFPWMLDEMADMFIGPGAEPAIKMYNPKADPQKVLRTLAATQPVEALPYIQIASQPIILTTANLEGIACCEFRKYYNQIHQVGYTGKRPSIRSYKPI